MQRKRDRKVEAHQLRELERVDGLVQEVSDLNEEKVRMKGKFDRLLVRLLNKRYLDTTYLREINNQMVVTILKDDDAAGKKKEDKEKVEEGV